MSRMLTCYAVGGKDGWEAICVDLDLAVQGGSFREVYDTLNEAIRDYLDSVAAEEPAQAARLLKRSVPWHVRARLVLGFWWTWLRHHDDDEAAGFTVACRA